VILTGVKRRFEAQFEVILYTSPSDIVCDALYVIKRGRRGAVQARVPELNHAFHQVDEPHGHRFAAVSDWLARTATRNVALPRGRQLRLPRVRPIPAVPHIVRLPSATSDFRSQLGIRAELTSAWGVGLSSACVALFCSASSPHLPFQSLRLPLTASY
jgi:hypothetical protein